MNCWAWKRNRLRQAARLEAECRANVVRLEGLLAEARRLKTALVNTPDGDYASRSADGRVVELTMSVALEKARLAKLTGGIVGDLARLAKNIRLAMTEETAYSGRSLEQVEELR